MLLQLSDSLLLQGLVGFLYFSERYVIGYIIMSLTIEIPLCNICDLCHLYRYIKHCTILVIHAIYTDITSTVLYL